MPGVTLFYRILFKSIHSVYHLFRRRSPSRFTLTVYIFYTTFLEDGVGVDVPFEEMDPDEVDSEILYF